MSIKNSFSFFRLNKWGVIFSSGLTLVMALVLVMAPSIRNLSKAAGDCLTQEQINSGQFDSPQFNPSAFGISPSQAQTTGCDQLYTIAGHLDNEGPESYRKSLSANSGD